MARDFAKKFYNSKRWEIARQLCIDRAHGLCERCGEPGYIVHHKTYLRPSNIDEARIALNEDNLEYLCLNCHNLEHNPTRFDELGNPLQIPLSGKSWGY